MADEPVLTAEPVPESPAAAPPPAPQRALALDALRGWAIFTMCLSGVVPWTGLPNWMYHAQYPRFTPEPVERVAFNPEWAGVTWVDMVFPMFLFAMGVAIPLALAGRLARGASMGSLVAGIFGRGIALVFFAIYAQQIMPHQINLSAGKFAWWMATFSLGGEQQVRWFLAIAGFAILFPVYTRFPRNWPAVLQLVVRLAGLAAAVGFLIYINTPLAEGEALFRKIVSRFDIILLVLANVAVLGSLIWLATRDSLVLRLGSMALVFAALQSMAVEGSWTQFLLRPRLPWLFNFEFAKYLFVIIPGTIVGDAMLSHQRAALTEASLWSSGKRVALAAACVLFIVLTMIGLQERAMTPEGKFERVWAILVPVLGIPVLAVGLWWLRGAGSAPERLLRTLARWGTFWLILGFLVEPSQGGIRKDHATMSYHFVMTGLSVLLLMALTIVIDLFGVVRPFRLLIATGQNPMVAYTGIRSFATPLAGLTGLEGWAFASVFTTPWLKALYGALKTTALAAFTALCTRLKIIWRT